MIALGTDKGSVSVWDLKRGALAHSLGEVCMYARRAQARIRVCKGGNDVQYLAVCFVCTSALRLCLRARTPVGFAPFSGGVRVAARVAADILFWALA